MRPLTFVRIEFVGGPWDGKTEVHGYPLPFMERHIPMPSGMATVSVVPDEASVTQVFRTGLYRRDRTARVEEMFDVFSVTHAEAAALKVPLREAVMYVLVKKRPVIFTWEGE